VLDAKNLRKNKYVQHESIIFSPANDIIDGKSILRDVLGLDLDSKKEVYDFVQKEINNQQLNIKKVDSVLTSIINILSKENLTLKYASPELNSFQIERKINFNNLVFLTSTINEYSGFYKSLNKKYREFDKVGINKSLAVFTKIREIQDKLICKGEESYDLFFDIIDEVKIYILQSPNFDIIDDEILGLCVNIIVVDAFTRCKIYKNPEGYKHIITR
jgi:hypothetical protein